jgi:hypothetical protein
MKFREITADDIPALFAVRAATHENRLSREELTALGITALKAYSFYRRHGWLDDRLENGLRYMVKMIDL